MAEVPKTMAQLLASFPTNAAREITAVLVRDFVASIIPARGRFSLTATAPTSFLNTVDYVKGEIGMGVLSGYERFFTYANGRLTYTGVVDVHVDVDATLSFDAASKNQVMSIRVVKNATPTDPDSQASETDRKTQTGGDVGSTAIHFDGVLSTGDYLEIWLRNQTSITAVTIRHLYFRVKAGMETG